MRRLLKKLAAAYYFDEPAWYDADKPRSLPQLIVARDRSTSSARVAKAIRAIEEGDEKDRDAENLLRRARIELNKRNTMTRLARQLQRGGMFG